MGHLTYTYDSGRISHYSLKKVEGSCHRDPDRTVLIGVMCKFCPHHCGMKDRFIICDWEGYQKDDESEDVDVREIRHKINERLEYNALCALDY